MNRTKSVLLAAGFGLALAFTLSCSGDDGTDGVQGTSCSAEDKDSHIEIKCGAEIPIEMAKVEWCGTTPYNPATHFCNYLGEVKILCNGQQYYPDKYCSNGTIKQYGYVNCGNPVVCNTVEIGEKVWMAENLNYNVEGSVCYDNNSSNCITYGRLYDWATAMALSPDCNSSTCESQIQTKHRGICPEGWHIPSDAEWTALTDYVGKDPEIKLMSKSGWNVAGNMARSNGTDDYGFSALPGGYGSSYGDFSSIGN